MLILKPYSHMPITVCITQYHITCVWASSMYNITILESPVDCLCWDDFGHKYVKCLSKHPDSFFQGFYDQQYCYTCQKASWMTAKHTKCGSKSVIFLLSITLIYSCIFFTTVHFSDKRDGALYIYLRFYILPYLLVLFLAYHPYISFHFWGLFFLFMYKTAL